MAILTRAVLLTGLACRLAGAAPSAFNFIQQRDSNVEYDAFYQEIVHIVAMTSTVYVAAPSSTPAPPPSPQSSQAEGKEEPSKEIEAPAETKEEESSGSSESPVQQKAASDSEGKSGMASFYDPGMGSCGLTSSGDEYVVALSKSIMQAHGGNPNANPNCGKEIIITHGGISVTAKVVDTCPGCPDEGDIDLSPSCFSKLASKDKGKIDITWSWA